MLWRARSLLFSDITWTRSRAACRRSGNRRVGEEGRALDSSMRLRLHWMRAGQALSLTCDVGLFAQRLRARSVALALGEVAATKH